MRLEALQRDAEGVVHLSNRTAQHDRAPGRVRLDDLEAVRAGELLNRCNV